MLLNSSSNISIQSMEKSEVKSGTFEFTYESTIGGYKAKSFKQVPFMLPKVEWDWFIERSSLPKVEGIIGPTCFGIEGDIVRPIDQVSEFYALFIHELYLKYGSNSSNV